MVRGLYVYGSGDFSDSRIYRNQTPTYGGGVYYSGTGALMITNSEVSDNSAQFGGGMTLVSGTLIMVGSTIRNNNASYSGAGIETYVNTTINNTTISGNLSANRVDRWALHRRYLNRIDE